MNEGALEPVGLVRIQIREIVAKPTEALVGPLRSDSSSSPPIGSDPGRNRDLFGQLLDCGDQVAQAMIVGELEGRHGHFRRHRGVPVTVAADPGPESDRRAIRL